MSIHPYTHTDSSGKKQTLYMVHVEAINLYTSRRVQKRRRGVLSLPKAERLERELWLECKNDRPEVMKITHWGLLVSRYLGSFKNDIRSAVNPNGISPKAYKSKRSHLRHTQAWDGLHLDLISQQFVIEFLKELEKTDGFTRSMVFHIQKEAKCVMNFAVSIGVVKHNSLASMKMLRVPQGNQQALNEEEANKLLLEAKRRDHPYFNIWLLSMMLGLRRSELAGLKWTDVNLNSGLVSLQRQLIPREGIVDRLKGKKSRVVAIPGSVLPALKELKVRSTSDLVIDVDCEHWRNGTQSKVLRDFCKEIGLKPIRHHDLRSTHITLSLVAGIPLGIVKENVGHSKLSTTDRYFRASGIGMQGQMDSLDLKIPGTSEGELVDLAQRRR